MRNVDAPTVTADFVSDLQEHAEAVLSSGGYEVPTDPDDPRAALYAYANLQRRLIDAVPRAVHESAALNRRILSTELRAGVERVRAVLEAGGDLRPYQSKLVTKSATYEDHLLNDWGIHHFHLGALQPGATHCDRTGELLFAWIEEDRALLIDVLDHGSFEEQELLEIVHVEWPDVLRRFQMPLVTDIRPEFKGEERELLRKAGAMMATKLSDGTVLMPPGGGINTAATGAATVISVDSWVKQVRDLEEKSREAATAIAEAVAENTGTIPDRLLLKLRVTEVGRVIVEEGSSLIFRFGNPGQQPGRRE